VSRLAGKSIVVTGGSSGLGHAMAVRFAREGADVVVGDLREDPREGGAPETLAYSHARTPFPRLGRPEDVASLAVFVASDECTYMSGANVPVDGGWMAY